jgi:hypothetical protein
MEAVGKRSKLDGFAALFAALAGVCQGALIFAPACSNWDTTYLASQRFAIAFLAISRRAFRRECLSLYFMHYNFVRPHQTLKITPAMAANDTPRLWETSDMLVALKSGNGP